MHQLVLASARTYVDNMAADLESTPGWKSQPAHSQINDRSWRGDGDSSWNHPNKRNWPTDAPQGAGAGVGAGVEAGVGAGTYVVAPMLAQRKNDPKRNKIVVDETMK